MKIKNYKLKPEICLNELLKHDFEYTDRYERWYDFYDDVTKMYIDNDGFFCNEGYWIEHYSEEDAGDTYHIPEQRIDEDKEHWIQDLIDADLIDIVEVIDEQS